MAQLKDILKNEMNKQGSMDIYKITKEMDSNDSVEYEMMDGRMSLNTLNNLEYLVIGWDNQAPAINLPIFHQEE